MAVLDPKTVELLNQCTPQNFMASYAIAKITDTPPSATKTEGNQSSSLDGLTEPLKDSSNGLNRDRVDN